MPTKADHDTMESGSNRILYVVSLNHATNDGSVYLLSSLFPIVLSLFNVTVFQVGIIVAAGYLVNVLFQPIIGHYSEGKDPAKMLASGITVIAASIISFVFTTGFLSLLVSVVALRFGSSFFHPVGISTVSDAYKGSGLQKAMGFQSSFGNLGVLLAFVTAVPLYLLVGWRSTFLVFAGWTLADVLVTLAVLRGKSKIQLKREDLTSSKRSCSTRIPVFFVFAAFISGGTYAVVLNFANIFLGSRTNLSPSQANWIVSAFIGFAVLGALITGILTKFVHSTRLLGLSYLSASVTVTAFTVLAGNVLLASVTLVANGFFISSTYPLTYGELSRFLSSRTQQTGRAFGVLSSGQTVGASVLGLLSGYVSQYFGLTIAFGTVGALMLVGSVLTWFWSRRV